MMDMVKVTKEMIPETETVEVRGKDGVTVVVKRHVPFSMKQVLCVEYVSYINKTNDDIETMYSDYDRDLIKTILICKYYTNIDLSDIESKTDVYHVFDWIVFNGIYDALMDAVKYDIRFVDAMIDDMLYAIRENYKKEHSMEYALKKTFGFLLTGQDFINTLMDMPDVNNEIIKAFSALKKSTGEKKSDGKLLTPNGIVVSIAKKNV